VAAGEVIAHIDEPFSDQRFEVETNVAGTLIGMAVPQVVFSGYALVHVARR
jgi:predicted deacylase